MGADAQRPGNRDDAPVAVRVFCTLPNCFRQIWFEMRETATQSYE